jgi:putative tricarboxylic transport membrane protein
MVTMIGSFVGASFGITEIIFFAPVSTKVALEFGPAEIFSIMLLGLLAGSTSAWDPRSRESATTSFGLLLGMLGTDIYTGTPRFTLGITNLLDGIEIVALALGKFGIAEFLKNVNKLTIRPS